MAHASTSSDEDKPPAWPPLLAPAARLPGPRPRFAASPNRLPVGGCSLNSSIFLPSAGPREPALSCCRPPAAVRGADARRVPELLVLGPNFEARGPLVTEEARSRRLIGGRDMPATELETEVSPRIWPGDGVRSRLRCPGDGSRLCAPMGRLYGERVVCGEAVLRSSFRVPGELERLKAHGFDSALRVGAGTRPPRLTVPGEGVRSRDEATEEALEGGFDGGRDGVLEGGREGIREGGRARSAEGVRDCGRDLSAD